MGRSSDRAGAGGTVAQDAANTDQPTGGAAVAVMTRVRAPLPVVPIDPNQFNRPVPDGQGRVSVGPGIQTYDRPWDKEAADFFTGEHALIRRPVAQPSGRQEDLGLPSPVVYRPTPVPWYCGTIVTPETPAPAPTPSVIDDSTPAFVQPADVRARLGLS